VEFAIRGFYAVSCTVAAEDSLKFSYTRPERRKREYIIDIKLYTFFCPVQSISFAADGHSL
jgi:hypothetical protein